MQPEIYRRCQECGAAIRAHGKFCPQCGKPLSVLSGAAVNPESSVVAESEGQPHAQGATPVRPAGEPAPDVKRHQDDAAVHVARERPESVVVSAEAAGDDGAHARIHRARMAARDVVEERLAPRVEKIRQASSVVIDEAAEDPGLRFVLIAAALFIVSLLLLLLSHILG
jgi:hypothetical protein